MDLVTTLVAIVATVLATTAVCHRLDVSSPLVLIVVGIVGSYLRFIPDVQLHPQVVLLGLLPQLTQPVVLVLNKIERLKKHALLPLIEWFSSRHAFADVVPVSAATGDNVEALEQVLLSHLPEGPPLYPDDYLTDQSARSLAAEMVREQVLAHTRAELPFTTAVVVDRYEEPEDDEDGPLAIYCSILVEEPSQKPILVGRGGEMIKAIGIAARKQIEAFFERRVYLDLHVKVREDWRENERTLDDLGLPKRRK